MFSKFIIPTKKSKIATLYIFNYTKFFLIKFNNKIYILNTLLQLFLYFNIQNASSLCKLLTTISKIFDNTTAGKTSNMNDETFENHWHVRSRICLKVFRCVRLKKRSRHFSLQEKLRKIRANFPRRRSAVFGRHFYSWRTRRPSFIFHRGTIIIHTKEFPFSFRHCKII